MLGCCSCESKDAWGRGGGGGGGHDTLSSCRLARLLTSCSAASLSLAVLADSLMFFITYCMERIACHTSHPLTALSTNMEYVHVRTCGATGATVHVPVSSRPCASQGTPHRSSPSLFLVPSCTAPAASPGYGETPYRLLNSPPLSA